MRVLITQIGFVNTAVKAPDLNGHYESNGTEVTEQVHV